ncbi:MAG: DUF4160 domain-containing protein [Planctomycetota bacterium]
MPELSRFYGIVIQMYFNDHAPPHFHARYQDQAAQIRIDDLGMMAGKLPPRILGLVVEWAAIHQEELLAAWAHAQASEMPERIDPLP